MDRFDIFREWNIDHADHQDELTEYCFIRLYQTEYHRKLSFGNIVKTVNEYIVKPGNNDKKYTHAAINYQLNDNFVGVNFGNGNSAIKIEHLRTLGSEKDSPQDRKNSKFDVFCLKLTKDEYKYLKKNLSNLKIDSKFSYSFLRLLAISLSLLLNKAKQRIANIIGEDANSVRMTNLSEVEKSLICSTFVAYVLSQTSPIYKDYFDFTDKLLKRVTPNDLTFIPGIEFMFGGKWTEYNTKAKQYISQHPEFKKYL